MDCKEYGLHLHIGQPHSPAQKSGMEKVDIGESPIEEDNQDIEVQPTAGQSFAEYPNYNELQHLINNQWQLFCCSEDVKQPIVFGETYYPKSPIDHYFNFSRYKIPEQFSYTSRWTRYSPIYAMDKQLPE